MVDAKVWIWISFKTKMRIRNTTKIRAKGVFKAVFRTRIHPQVFEPPGSESIIICTDPDSDPFISKQLNEENLDYFLVS